MLRIKRILVPCDFSSFSEAALRRATGLAQHFKAELHLLHVVTQASLAGRGESQDDSARQAKERMDQLLPPHMVVEQPIERHVAAGSAPREICRYAQQYEIDLIVMGTHGRTGLAHWTLGSVAEKVLRAAPCPVLVVQQSDREEDLVRQAARTLGDEFGSSLAGEAGDTRATLVGRLMRKLEISDQAAAFAVEKLQALGELRWEDEPGAERSQARRGTWRIGAAGDSENDQPAFVLRTDNSPAVDLITRAAALRASDIHIDPSDSEYAVRFRIDGRLEPYCRLAPDVAGHLIQQYKTLARLNIADPFRPQEGRLRLPPTFSSLEVRITTAPVAAGEAVALRLFDRENVFRPLDQLGLGKRSIAAIDEILRRGEGLVLVTGPAGSGKTTTVYAMLASLGTGQRNIVSIEDPVEFPCPFVRQLAVDEAHGVTMSSGLRTLLRMDPDAVFLGEIRDGEAADIAMRAASSGKYVFSTLHTRDVASTVTALRDLHLDSRSLAGNLTGIVSQRIVRRLCPQCSRPRAPTDDEKQMVARSALPPPEQLADAVGCASCRGTGYRGRVGVFEVVVASEEVLRAIAAGAAEHELRQRIRATGTPDLMADALAKAGEGITSLDEVQRMRWV